jgi:ankyrin repeat protein
MLIDAGISLESRSAGATPLITAVLQGYRDIVQELIAKNVNLEASTPNGDTSLMLAVSSNNPAIVQALIEAGANLEATARDGSTALVRAVAVNKANLVELLLAAGANPTPILPHSVVAYHLETLLHVAARRGYGQVASVLLAQGFYIDEDCGPQYGKTPLFLAAEGGHIGMVRLLLDSGANINKLGTMGRTPLGCAAHGGYTDIAQLLLDAGAQPDPVEWGNITPLMLASTKCPQIVEMLLRHGANIHHSSTLGFTGIALAAMRDRDDIVRVFIAHGADVNIDLHDVVWNRSSRSLRLLVEAGCDPIIADHTGETPLRLTNDDATIASLYCGRT